MSDFDAVDNAKVDDRDPKLPPNGLFVLATTENIKWQGENGLSYIVKAKLMESSTHPNLVGLDFSIPFSRLNAPDKKTRDRQNGKVRAYLAAVLGVDHKGAVPSPALKGPNGQPLTWGAVTELTTQESQILRGKRFVAKTGPETKAQSGFMYIPVTFESA